MSENEQQREAMAARGIGTTCEEVLTQMEKYSAQGTEFMDVESLPLHNNVTKI